MWLSHRNTSFIAKVLVCRGDNETRFIMNEDNILFIKEIYHQTCYFYYRMILSNQFIGIIYWSISSIRWKSKTENDHNWVTTAYWLAISCQKQDRLDLIHNNSSLINYTDADFIKRLNLAVNTDTFNRQIFLWSLVADWKEPPVAAGSGSEGRKLLNQDRFPVNSPDPWRRELSVSLRTFTPNFCRLSPACVIKCVGVFWWKSCSLFPHACWSEKQSQIDNPETLNRTPPLKGQQRHQRREVKLHKTTRLV